VSIFCEVTRNKPLVTVFNILQNSITSTNAMSLEEKIYLIDIVAKVEG